jgi:hypothetical protein
VNDPARRPGSQVDDEATALSLAARIEDLVVPPGVADARGVT